MVADGVAAVEAGCEVPEGGGAPNSDEAGLAAAVVVEGCAFENKPPAVDDAAGAVDTVGVEAAGLLLANKPPAAPVVAPDVEGAGVLVAAAPAKSPPAGAAGLLAPKSPPAVDAPDVAGVLAPNRALPPLGGLLPVCPPPKSPGVEVDVVCAAAGAAADLDESVGGAPAGVVDASENEGLAGVAAAVAVWPPGVLSALFPKSELPVLANMPEDGAPDAEGVP